MIYYIFLICCNFSCPASSLEKIKDDIRLPVPETEELIPKAKDSHVSSINLKECEN